MRVLVCGGRDFEDRIKLYLHMLDLSHFCGRTFTEVIHGAARGADRLAGEWARDHGVPARAFPADWTRYGKRAGPIRNQQMLDEGKPEIVIAFPGGSGTADMVRRARAAGLEVIEIKA